MNENDATATDEISFGDNDALAAQVAVLVRARLLVLLTSVEGVLDPEATRDPRRRGRTLGGVRPRQRVRQGRHGEQGRRCRAGRGRGRPDGDRVRRRAALPACSPAERHAVRRAATGESAFKLWLRFGKRVTGQLHVDAGAQRAVRRRGASLLAVGVGAHRRRHPRRRRRRALHARRHAVRPRDQRARRAELEARPPNVEAVHRDRLILY